MEEIIPNIENEYQINENIIEVKKEINEKGRSKDKQSV